MNGSDSRSRISIGISLIVSFALLWAVLAQLEWRDLRASLLGVDWVWVGVGVVAMLGYQWFRAERFRRLVALPRDGRMYTTMCLQSVLRKLLPSWLGEASQIWLLRRRHGTTVARGAATLMVARSVDLAMFLAALVIALASTAMAAQGPILYLVAMLTVALAALLGGMGVLLRCEPVLDGARQHPHPLVAWVAGKMAHLAAGLREGADARALLPVTVYTLAMWFLMYVRLACFVQALGADLAYLQTFWVFVLLFPMNLLPIRGVANLGTHEAAWFIGLSVVGVAREQAAVLAVGSHVLIFMAVGACLIVALGGLALERVAAQAFRCSAIDSTEKR